MTIGTGRKALLVSEQYGELSDDEPFILLSARDGISIEVLKMACMLEIDEQTEQALRGTIETFKIWQRENA